MDGMSPDGNHNLAIYMVQHRMIMMQSGMMGTIYEGNSLKSLLSCRHHPSHSKRQAGLTRDINVTLHIIKF
jgi:hypothetical protein